MNVPDLFDDGFGRVRGIVHRVVGALSIDQLTARPGDRANSIAWLVWHLTRIQDNHIADVAKTVELWTQGWADRFDLPFSRTETGYGQGPDDVARVVVAGELLVGYYDAVHQHTIQYVRSLTEGDLDEIVDDAWDPPVTLGVRLVSVLDDDLQHAGQAAYARGLIESAHR